jgi:hypothetical protein
MRNRGTGRLCENAIPRAFALNQSPVRSDVPWAARGADHPPMPQRFERSDSGLGWELAKMMDCFPVGLIGISGRCRICAATTIAPISVARARPIRPKKSLFIDGQRCEWRLVQTKAACAMQRLSRSRIDPFNAAVGLNVGGSPLVEIANRSDTRSSFTASVP